MRIDIVSVFPAYFDVLGLSLLGKAQTEDILDVYVHDLRAFTHDRHRTVDDTPYGGGPGMVMRPEPWGEALDFVLEQGARDPGEPPVLVVPTPAGRPFGQGHAQELSEEPRLVFACGRYEGIDQRVIEDARQRFTVHEVSLGDYVVNGGEVAALAVIEAVARLIPGVIGNRESLDEESHVAGVLEAPGYTKPAAWRGLDVPEVLMSGNHGAVAGWRREVSLRRTCEVRPDLIRRLDPRDLSPADRAVLAEYGWQVVDGQFSPIPPPVAD
ncbi:MAG TPA: tRNA (guanosine(37)-N1)-methyltransferase TrmD [Actinomycetes bacterium]|nr:tRNA (guanosine(37)-N1)-methyltransferase TrmD [Actinomycetes bacterium]